MKIDYNQRNEERGKPVTERELNVVLSNQITALQSSLKEKEKECEELKVRLKYELERIYFLQKEINFLRDPT